MQSENIMTSSYFATSDKVKKALEDFQKFDVDTQLGLFWFGYLDLKENLTPANTTSSQTTAEAVFHRIIAMSKEEQLQAQRDIVSHANSEISQLYGGLDPSAKLDVWLRISQAMEDGRAIPVPQDYKLPENTNQFTQQVKSLEFEERVEFSRNLAQSWGAASGNN
jgi:Orange carotenoid protein, N-terminal